MTQAQPTVCIRSRELKRGAQILWAATVTLSYVIPVDVSHPVSERTEKTMVNSKASAMDSMRPDARADQRWTHRPRA